MILGLLGWLAQLIAALAIALSTMAAGHVAGAFTDTAPPPIEPGIVATNDLSSSDPELPTPLPEQTPEPDPTYSKWKWCRYLDNFREPDSGDPVCCRYVPGQDSIRYCYPVEY